MGLSIPNLVSWENTMRNRTRCSALLTAALLVLVGAASAQKMVQITKNGTFQNDQWPVLSKDGYYLAFVGERNYTYEIFSADTQSLKPTQLTSGAKVDAPWALAMNGDGTWVGFIGAKNVWLQSRMGGAPKQVTNFSGTLGAAAFGISMSDDAKLLAFTTYDSATKIYDFQVVDTTTSSLVNISKSTTASDWCTGWISGDGKKVVFTAQAGNPGGQVWTANVDGTGVKKIASFSTGQALFPRLDERATIAAFESDASGVFEIYTVRTDGTGLTNVSQNSGGADRRVWLSADGERIAWKSRRNANSDVYMAFPDGTGLRQLTSFGGVHPDNPNDALTISGDGTLVVFCSRYNVNGGNPEADWELYLWRDGITRLGQVLPGAKFALVVEDPATPGAAYLLRAAFGRSPGFLLPGVGNVPLNPDALFWLSGAAPSIFQNFAGVLDANGVAKADVVLPNNPSLKGFHFYASGVSVNGSTVKIFNPIRLEIE